MSKYTDKAKAVPECKVVPFKANWIAKKGGVFNCMSWTVKE